MNSPQNMSMTFIGIDASWKATKPSGVAIVQGTAAEGTILRLVHAETHADVADIVNDYRSATTILAVDAPLVVTNPEGCRECERGIGREFSRFHASAHAMNRPRFERYGLGGLVERLESLGFRHGVEGDDICTDGLRMFEVYPHPAHIRLFDRDSIIRYKKGKVAQKRAGLGEVRALTAQLEGADRDPTLHAGAAGSVFVAEDLSNLRGRFLKRYEDLLDAWLCAYPAMHLARWGSGGNEVFGSRDDGYIVVPRAGEKSK
jgi:predicted RNase H-like nuclease